MGEGLRFGGRAVESVRVDLSAELPVAEGSIAALCRLHEARLQSAPRVAVVMASKPDGLRAVGPFDRDGVGWWVTTLDVDAAARVVDWRPLLKLRPTLDPPERLVVLLEAGDGEGLAATVGRCAVTLDPAAAERWRTPQPVGVAT